MSIDISRVARAIRDLTVESLEPVKLSHAQEYVAAAFGFKSLAACQTDSKLLPEGFFDNSRFVVLNDDGLLQRERELEPGVVRARGGLVALTCRAIQSVYSDVVVCVSSERPNLPVSAAIAEVLCLPDIFDFDDVRYNVVENKIGEVLGFRLDFDDPEWKKVSAEIKKRHGQLVVFVPVVLRLRLKHGDSPQERYYLHGDRVEDDATQFFCARCDGFVDSSHFQSAHPGGNGELYFAGQRLWERTVARHKMFRRRPLDAENTLAQAANAERDAYEESRSPFHRWILEQTKRRGALGDLARDVKSDRSFPVRAVTRGELIEYLQGRAGWEGPLKAFKRAWKEFSRLGSSHPGDTSR